MTHVELLPTTTTMKRHVVHDERSRAFPLNSGRPPTIRTRWMRDGPIFDQGLLNHGQGLGCCTMCAGYGLVMTRPFSTSLHRMFTLTDVEAGYREETLLDDREIPGHWPPDDTGSAGIYMAKVLQRRGLIGEYRHAFSLAAALHALTTGPIAVGTLILYSMEDPKPDGTMVLDTRYKPAGAESAVAGGHEYVVDEYDPADGGWVWITNSWGEGWGVGGRARMSVHDFGWLLRQQGDVIQPLTAGGAS